MAAAIAAAFTLLHDKAVQSGPLALCPTMDLLLCSAAHRGGALTLMRWVAWQRVFACPATGLASEVSALCWSPDGKCVVSRRADGRLQLLPIEQETQLNLLPVATRSTSSPPPPMVWVIAAAVAAAATRNGTRLAAISLCSGVSHSTLARGGGGIAILGPERLPPLTTDDDEDASTDFGAWDAEAVAERGAGGGAATAADRGASHSSIALRVGVRGHTSEPAAVLADGAPVTVPLLIVGDEAQGFEGPRIRVLAFGTVPLLQHVLQIDCHHPAAPSARSGLPSTPPLHVSAAPDLSSIASALVSLSPAPSSPFFRLVLTAAPSAATALPAAAAFADRAAFADSCIRHALRSIAFAHAAWSGGVAGVGGALRSLEADLLKWEEGGGGDDLLADAAAFYPCSHAPLAVAEMHRTVTVGTRSGALQQWAETTIGGEAGLLRLQKGVEAGAASVEILLVTHVARSLESLLLCLTQLGETAGVNAGAGAVPIDTQQLCIAGEVAAAVVEAQHALALTQLARACGTHARSSLGAVFAWLSILQQGYSAAGTGGGRGDPSLLDTSILSGLEGGGGGGKRAFRVQQLHSTDVELLRQALEPRSEPMLWGEGGSSSSSHAPLSQPSPVGAPRSGSSGGGIGNDSFRGGGRGSKRGAAAAADPLGLGFSSSPIYSAADADDDAGEEADPLGLGFATANTTVDSVEMGEGGGPAAAAPSADPLGLGFGGSLLDDSTALNESGGGGGGLDEDSGAAAAAADPTAPFMRGVVGGGARVNASASRWAPRRVKQRELWRGRARRWEEYVAGNIAADIYCRATHVPACV